MTRRILLSKHEKNHSHVLLLLFVNSSMKNHPINFWFVHSTVCILFFLFSLFKMQSLLVASGLVHTFKDIWNKFGDCIFRHVVWGGTLTWLFLVVLFLGFFTQYLTFWKMPNQQPTQTTWWKLILRVFCPQKVVKCQNWLSFFRIRLLTWATTWGPWDKLSLKKPCIVCELILQIVHSKKKKNSRSIFYFLKII